MSDARSSRTALITGTAGGIGTALCTAFKNAGYRVVGTDIREDASSCDAFIPLDLRTLSASDAARQAGLERLREAITGNELNVLVNNAAIQILGVTERVTIDDWRVTLDTNL
ncbi:MAG: SDR family NAD(P)-dependent oxidoreductase, partial [Vicinamibacterales bacterium]